MTGAPIIASNEEALALLRKARKLTASARERLGRAARMQPDSFTADKLRLRAWICEDDASRIFDAIEAYLGGGAE